MEDKSVTVLKAKTINSLKDFTQVIEDTTKTSVKWYRGCGRCSHKLLPSLYRHPDTTTLEQFIELENAILDRFKQRSVPYINRPSMNEWEYLFFMQHARIPTRLLDWTENPYIALFFALTSAPYKMSPNRSYKERASVWILDPVLWNQKVLSHVGFKGGILSVSDKQVGGYSPNIDLKLMNSDPISIYGTHNSARIVAQRGVFTVFGKNLNPMEQVYENTDFPPDSLMKLIIPKNRIADLLKSMLAIGYSHSVVFPDLEGLALEIKRYFGYWD
jgi:hypothetical protein